MTAGLVPWPVDGHLLPVSSYHPPSVCVCIWISLPCKDTSHTRLGVFQWSYFTFTVSLKILSPLSTILSYWVLGLQHTLGEGFSIEEWEKQNVVQSVLCFWFSAPLRQMASGHLGIWDLHFCSSEQRRDLSFNLITVFTCLLFPPIFKVKKGVIYSVKVLKFWIWLIASPNCHLTCSSVPCVSWKLIAKSVWSDSGSIIFSRNSYVVVCTSYCTTLARHNDWSPSLFFVMLILVSGIRYYETICGALMAIDGNCLDLSNGNIMWGTGIV